MKILATLSLFFLMITNCIAQLRNGFAPGEKWYDTDGNIINAHGNGMLYENGKYYWVGEKRDKHKSLGINIYSSKDLYNWKFESMALSPNYADTLSDIAFGSIMERPKIIYNKKNNKYVMWFHLELRNQGYHAARVGVAESKKLTGPYTYLYSFRPNGHMSRDMTLYVDENEEAYLIYSSRDNYDLRIVQLTDDYLLPTKKDSLLFSQHREAPAIFKRKGTYYLITSGCTGWAPNKAMLHIAKNLFGPWKQENTNIMVGVNAEKTFNAQSTYVLPVKGKKDAFIFMANRWNPKELIDSRYIWLPIEFKNDLPVIEWRDAWNIKIFNPL